MPMLASAALTLARLRIVIFPLRVFFTVFVNSHSSAIFTEFCFYTLVLALFWASGIELGGDCIKSEMSKALSQQASRKKYHRSSKSLTTFLDMGKFGRNWQKTYRHSEPLAKHVMVRNLSSEILNQVQHDDMKKIKL